MKYYVILFVILINIKNTLSQNFEIVPYPDWVNIVSVDSTLYNVGVKEGVSAGYYLSLADYQYNLEKNTDFVHNVYNVISYSGITEASQLSISYDTAYQKLKIHHLFIWRKGNKIDRTKEATFKILNNEFNLNDGIYHGNITAYANLEDIRKDDLIDFAYSIEGDNPIFNGEKYLFVPLQDGTPLDLYSIKIFYAKNTNYQYACVGCDSSIVVEKLEENDYKMLKIERKKLKPLEFETNMPDGFIPYSYLVLSSINSWREVNDWAQSVFKLDATPDVTLALEESLKGTELLEEKISKLINYVQDDIRYMGIETGIGSIKPSPPDTIVKRRFGDCKDKSLLLVSLLKNIGVERAYPVLVNTFYKKELAHFLPTNQIFNHCIVRFDINDSIYYIDPTITQQGGDYKSTAINDYGKALVIGLNSDSLIDMKPSFHDLTTYYTDEFYFKSFTDPAIVEIESVRYGIDADIKRNVVERQSKQDMSKYIIDELSLKYENVKEETEPICIDSIHKNQITCKYKYKIGDVWKDGDDLKSIELRDHWFYTFEPIALLRYLNEINCTKRKYDYELDYPRNIEYKYIFHFPKEILIVDNYKKFDNTAFILDESIEQLSPKDVLIKFNYKTKLPYINAKDFEKLCDEKEKFLGALNTTFYFKK